MKTFTKESALALLQSYQNPMVIKSLEYYGLPVLNALGITNPCIKDTARQIGKNHTLALQLWDTGILEAMILATLIAEPMKISPATMDQWITKIDAWSVCDSACGYLFWKTAVAYDKAITWSFLSHEYEKRAGFALMAMLAVHDKKADDSKFLSFLDRIEEEAGDPRNFVKKAVNWALRQIGKRSIFLHEKSIKTAEKIARQQNKTARWIAADALRELKSEPVMLRLIKRVEKQGKRPLILIIFYGFGQSFGP